MWLTLTSASTDQQVPVNMDHVQFIMPMKNGATLNFAGVKMVVKERAADIQRHIGAHTSRVDVSGTIITTGI